MIVFSIYFAISPRNSSSDSLRSPILNFSKKSFENSRIPLPISNGKRTYPNISTGVSPEYFLNCWSKNFSRKCYENTHRGSLINSSWYFSMYFARNSSLRYPKIPFGTSPRILPGIHWKMSPQIRRCWLIPQIFFDRFFQELV